MRALATLAGGSCAVLLLTALPARGQQRIESTPFSDVTRAAWYHIQQLVVAAAAQMPEEHYGFRPAKEVRSFGEIVGHIADDHFAICSATTGRPAPPAKFEKLASKSELARALQESTAVCDMAYGLLTDQNAAFRYRVFGGDHTRLALLTLNVTHDSQHYGNLVTYMRMKGVVPPSTAGAR